MPIAVIKNHNQDTGPTSAASRAPTETEISDMVKDHGLVTIMYFFSCMVKSSSS